MITKAIIEAIPSSTALEASNKFKVRIPIFDGTGTSDDDTPSEFLSEATFCCLPGLERALSVGDIVYVGFENDNYARPVILGHLYLGNYPTASKTTPSLRVGELEVSDLSPGASRATLPKETKLGDISPQDFANLMSFYKLLKNSTWYNETFNGGSNN